MQTESFWDMFIPHWYWVMLFFLVLMILLKHKPFEFILNEIMLIVRFVAKIVSYEIWRWGYHIVHTIVYSHMIMFYHLLNRKKDISKLDNMKDRHRIRD